MKIHPVQGMLFHADRQTDTTKAIVPFHNFAMYLQMGMQYRQPSDNHKQKLVNPCINYCK